jgi:hypothetical protein
MFGSVGCWVVGRVSRICLVSHIQKNYAFSFCSAVLSCIFAPKISFQRKGLQDGVEFGESIMRESHKRASVREYSRRSFTSGMMPSAMPSANSGASPEDEDGSSKSGHFQLSELAKDSENDDGVPGGPQRRGFFVSRLQKNPSFFRRNEESGVESIAEETHDDLLLEMTDSFNTSTSGEGTNNNKHFRNTSTGGSSSNNNGYMMTPAGMMDPTGAFAALQRSEMSSSSSGSSSQVPASAILAALPRQQYHQPMFDPQNAMEEQARMMEMTRKLMENHERMMKATDELMNEHTRLKEALNQSKESISGQGETTTNTTEMERGVAKHHNSEMTLATEEESNSSAESPDEAAKGETHT